VDDDAAPRDPGPAAFRHALLVLLALNTAWYARHGTPGEAATRSPGLRCWPSFTGNWKRAHTRLAGRRWSLSASPGC